MDKKTELRRLSQAEKEIEEILKRDQAIAPELMGGVEFILDPNGKHVYPGHAAEGPTGVNFNKYMKDIKKMLVCPNPMLRKYD